MRDIGRNDDMSVEREQKSGQNSTSIAGEVHEKPLVSERDKVWREHHDREHMFQSWEKKDGGGKVRTSKNECVRFQNRRNPLYTGFVRVRFRP